MRTKVLLCASLMILTTALNVVEAQGQELPNLDPKESLYGEWWLVGWNDGGNWFEVDTKYVGHHHLSIEIPREGYVMAYSMANEIFVGLLTLNGNEMIFGGRFQGCMTAVGYNLMENLFFEAHICDIKSYQLEGKLMKLYYTDNDYFVFSSYFDDGQELPISDKQKSGCLSRTRGYLGDDYLTETIILTKEGNILSVEVQNFISNCATSHFDVKSNISEGRDGAAYSLSINMSPVIEGEITSCECPFNVSFTIRDLEPNSFYLDCWWYKGQVELKEGEPLVLEAKKDDYRPLVEDGKVWKVGTISGNPVQIVDYYYLDGDTIIDGKTCKQMMCQRYVNPDYPYYENYEHPNSLSKVGAWYEKNQKVFFYDEKKHSMVLMYDFSIDANETVSLFDDYPPFIIGPKQTGGIDGFKGVYRDIIIRTNDGQAVKSTTWLEGVGGIMGPRINAFDPTLGDPKPEFLMSCTVGDEIIYLNDDYEDGATPEEARKHRFDFTHTIKTQPKAPIKREKSDTETQSLYGEYNDHRLGIHLDPLDDAYLVHITNESGQAIYEKTVNAGTIVALNIDISAYAKGRYIVTIENSRESFTGEFEVLTNGIVKLKNSRTEELKSIYNLQGLRLNSLQKGLNIVNRQKLIIR